MAPTLSPKYILCSAEEMIVQAAGKMMTKLSITLFSERLVSQTLSVLWFITHDHENMLASTLSAYIQNIPKVYPFGKKINQFFLKQFMYVL